MAAYIIALVDVKDAEQYQEYATRAGAAVESVGPQYGTRFLARGGRTVSLEGAPPPGRVVIVRFDSVEAAEAYYHSPEYQEARSHRVDAADAQFFIVEGVD